MGTDAARWQGKRVLVAGGTGFLGGHFARRLRQLGAEVTSCSRGEGVDLRDPLAAREAISRARPTVVINCAANQGGVAYQEECPGTILYDNTLIQLHTLDALRQVDPTIRYVNIIPACAYPAEPRDGAYRESELEAGPMHPSADNYGVTKRLAVLQARHYARQYGVASTCVVLANTYGPHDHFGPTRSHVLAALLERFREAHHTGAPEVVVWGRGLAERDLLYVDDAIEGTLRVVEQCPDAGLLNIGTGRGVSVREIAETVSGVVGYTGRITFDATRPEGPLRKILDIERLRQLLGWTPPTPLAEGVRHTLEWLETAQSEEAAA